MAKSGERLRAAQTRGVGQIVVVCVLIAAVFVLALVLFIRTNIEIASGYAERSSDFFASDLSAKMVSLMENQCSFMRARTYDDDLVALVEQEDERGESDTAASLESLLDKLVVSPSMSSAFIISCDSGTLYASDGTARSTATQPGIETWYRRMRKTSGNRLALVTGSSGGLDAYFVFGDEGTIPASYAGRPLYNDIGKLVAVLGVRVFGSAVQMVMHAVQVGSDQQGYCTTADGTVLYYSNRDVLPGSQISDVCPEFAALRGEMGDGSTSTSLASSWEGLGALLPRDQCLYQLRWREDFGCYLLTANRADELFGEVRAQVRNNVVILAVLILLVVALVTITLRWFRARLLTIARTDELTGLANRKSFGDGFERLRGRGELDGATLVLVDVDLFKHVNDTYGHTVGDVALQLVAQEVRTCVGEEGLAGRWGGDEFIGVLRMTSAEACARLRELVERVRGLVIDGGPQLTVSAGATTIAADLPINRIIEQADAALYLVKNQGRDGFAVYEEGVTITELEEYEPAMANPTPDHP